MRPWIGVDLDGTLAHYDEWRGPTHIGEPVLPMLVRVKEWLARGIEVRIVTARASDTRRVDVIPAIEAWCQQHIGQVLPVTATKDYAMLELWDDRCVQVIPNTGLRADRRDLPPCPRCGSIGPASNVALSSNEALTSEQSQ